jgi:hypothetical protein
MMLRFEVGRRAVALFETCDWAVISVFSGEGLLNPYQAGQALKGLRPFVSTSNLPLLKAAS